MTEEETMSESIEEKLIAGGMIPVEPMCECGRYAKCQCEEDGCDDCDCNKQGEEE